MTAVQRMLVYYGIGLLLVIAAAAYYGVVIGVGALALFVLGFAAGSANEKDEQEKRGER